MPIKTLFAERLKTARQNASLSQRQLGILAGIDEFAASARMNQYERGKHLPDLDTAKRLADALSVPMAYLYCPEDHLSQLLLAAYRVTPKQVEKLIGQICVE